jgi:hypothetical protein
LPRMLNIEFKVDITFSVMILDHVTVTQFIDLLSCLSVGDAYFYNVNSQI